LPIYIFCFLRANPHCTHCQSHTSQRTDQKLQKSLLCQRSQKLFLKNLPTLQKIKIHRHTAQQTQQRMTLNLNIDKTYNDTMDRRPAGNSRLPQWGLTWLNQMQCFYQHLCLVDSLVLRKPHCGKRQNVGCNCRRAPQHKKIA